MSVNISVDISQLKTKIQAIARSGDLCREDALRDVMSKIGKEVIGQMGRDTNRMVRAESQAFNALGCGPFPLPELKPSRRFDTGELDATFKKQIAKIERQVAYWTQWKEFYERQGRTSQKWYRGTILRNLRLWTSNLEKAIEQFGSLDPTSIVIKNKGRRLQYSVRPKVYGGRGFITRGSDSTTFTIVNMEWHAIIQERRHRLHAHAGAKAKAHGVKHTKNAYLRELTRKQLANDANVTG